MSTLVYEGQSLNLQHGETVLECLLRHDFPIPNMCRAGVCQSCLVKATAGAIPPEAQQGLKDTLGAQGYLLACLCRPGGDLHVVMAQDQRVPARIAALDRLSDSVVRVRLHVDRPFDYRAGQYITLLRDDGLARSYSLAGLPSDGHLELHVRRIPGGAMSGWLWDQAPAGAAVSIQGPTGQCFYLAGAPEQPLMLVGAGTGLAPLVGIARDALASGHTAPIWLFHGALAEPGLYLVDELRALAAAHANFTYVASVMQGPASHAVVGPLDACIRSAAPTLGGAWKAYVCGDPGFVGAFRKMLFLAGIPSGSIYADAFLPSVATARQT